MTPLPERKKTAEELARLRESLGVPPGARESTVPAAPEDPGPAPAERPPVEAKPVRSLRKSEQGPSPAPQPAPQDSRKIPSHRHSDREIQEIRRRDALAAMTPAPPNPKLLPASWFLIIPGYLLAIAGAGCFLWRGFPLPATAGCAIAALAIAAAILIRRPYSRHHAAFIAAIALLVLIFGVLHYFPPLPHAS